MSKLLMLNKMIPENVKQNSEKQRTMLIVVSWYSCTPWHLLVLVRVLWRRPCLFLAPSACAGHQESIIISRNEYEVSAIAPFWLLSWCPVLALRLGTSWCSRTRWEGAHIFSWCPVLALGAKKASSARNEKWVSAIASFWLLCLGARCLRRRWEGTLEPGACASALMPLYSYEERLVHTHANDVRG